MVKQGYQVCLWKSWNEKCSTSKMYLCLLICGSNVIFIQLIILHQQLEKCFGAVNKSSVRTNKIWVCLHGSVTPKTVFGPLPFLHSTLFEIKAVLNSTTFTNHVQQTGWQVKSLKRLGGEMWTFCLYAEVQNFLSSFFPSWQSYNKFSFQSMRKFSKTCMYNYRFLLAYLFYVKIEVGLWHHSLSIFNAWTNLLKIVKTTIGSELISVMCYLPSICVSVCISPCSC
jgi:hypothetical protein